MYGVINEMARYTGKSVRYVRRDLRKMLKAGMFPDGHLDDKETCFMLNNVIYRQYLETEKAYLEQKKSSEQEKNRIQRTPTHRIRSRAAESRSCTVWWQKEWNTSVICGI